MEEACFEFVTVKPEIDQQQFLLEDSSDNDNCPRTYETSVLCDNESNVINKISGDKSITSPPFDASTSVKADLSAEEQLKSCGLLEGSIALCNNDLSIVKKECVSEDLESSSQTILLSGLLNVNATNSKVKGFSNTAGVYVIAVKNKGNKCKRNTIELGLHETRFVIIYLEISYKKNLRTL